MQVILNSFIFFLLYFSLQLFLYRFLKINLNKISTILFIIGISVIIGFYYHTTEMLMNLININLMIICFYLIMLGIVNRSPALVIIDLIENKKIKQKTKLKTLFLKSKAGRAVEKRLKINISSNFIRYKKGKLNVNKNAEKIIIFFNLIKTIFRLKPDA